MLRIAVVLVVAWGALSPSAAAGEALVLETYDVGALTEPTRGVHGDGFGLPTPPEEPLWPDTGEEDAEGAPPFLTLDALVELVRASVRPAAWDEIEGSALRARGSRLEVVAPSDLQAEVARFLGRLWREAARRVTLEAHWIELTAVPEAPQVAGALARGRLDAEAVTALLSEARRPGNRVSSATTVVRPGVWSCLCQADRVSFVQDYDVEIAQASRVGDPVLGHADDGWALDVRAFPLSGGAVWVDLLAQRCAVDRPIRILGLEAEPFGAVDLPSAHVARIATSARVVAGGSFAAVVRSPERPEVLHVLLLGASATPPAAAEAGGPRRLDLAALLREDPDIRLARRPLSRGGAAPGLVRPDEGEDPPSREEWAEQLKAEVDPDAWLREGTWLTAHGDGLFLQSDPAVLDRATAWLGREEARALRTVRLRLTLREIPEGGAPREIGAASLDLPLGRVACLAAGVERRYVADWDVEVAQEARSGDPIVDTAFGGLWMNLRADASPVPDVFLLHLEHVLQRLDPRFEVRRPGNEVTGVFETPRIEVGISSRDLVLAPGVETTLDLGGSEGRRLEVRLTLER